MPDTPAYQHKHRNGQATQIEWISPTVLRTHSSFGPQVRRRRRTWRQRLVDVAILGLFGVACVLSLAAVVGFAIVFFALVLALGELAHQLAGGAL